LVATVVVALAATYLSDHYHAPPVIFALLLGMALNALSSEARYTPGIDLSARSLLRLSVALLGLRITFGQIGELGWSTAALVIVAVPLTIGFGWLFARAFKLDSRFGVLSGEPWVSAARRLQWPLRLHGPGRIRNATRSW